MQAILWTGYDIKDVNHVKITILPSFVFIVCHVLDVHFSTAPKSYPHKHSFCQLVASILQTSKQTDAIPYPVEQTNRRYSYFSIASKQTDDPKTSKQTDDVEKSNTQKEQTNRRSIQHQVK